MRRIISWLVLFPALILSALVIGLSMPGQPSELPHEDDRQ